jgi:hypothetical protein
MKIDKKTLDMLQSLDDDKLWKMFKLISSGAGIDLPAEKRPEDMSKLRAVISNLTQGDIDRASEILDIYKKGGDTK